MEVTLNTNHSQAVSTQCSKTFSGMHIEWGKKRHSSIGHVFYKFLGPSKTLMK